MEKTFPRQPSQSFFSAESATPVFGFLSVCHGVRRQREEGSYFSPRATKLTVESEQLPIVVDMRRRTGNPTTIVVLNVRAFSIHFCTNGNLQPRQRTLET